MAHISFLTPADCMQVLTFMLNCVPNKSKVLSEWPFTICRWQRPAQPIWHTRIHFVEDSDMHIKRQPKQAITMRQSRWSGNKQTDHCNTKFWQYRQSFVLWSSRRSGGISTCPATCPATCPILRWASLGVCSSSICCCYS